MAVTATNPYVVIVDGVNVDKDPLRALEAEQNTRLGEIPLSPADVDVGEVLAYADNGRGPAPASTGGTRPIRFAGRQLGYFRPVSIDIDASITLTDALHVGCLLRKKTTAAAVLTLDAHPDPTVGVTDGFACTLLRYPGSGDLQIVSSLTNQHEAAHTRVREGGTAVLFVDTVANAWFLIGQTDV